jgi:hypothetical protein
MDPSKSSFKSQLHAAMTAQFVRTKRSWKWLLVLAGALFLLSVGSVSTDAPRIAAVIDLLSLLGGGGLVLLRVHVQDLYGQGEVLRRAYFQLEGSGIRPRESLDSELPSSVRGIDMGVVFPDREYYGTSAMPGPDRLADNLEESAIYTRALARRTWKLCRVVIGFGVVFVLGLLYSAATSGPNGVSLMKLVPHVLNFFVLGFAIDLGVGFSRLEKIAAQTLDRLELMRKSVGLRIEDLIPAITDYDCALAVTGAPIPDFLYSGMETELDKRWKNIRARRHPNLPAVSSTPPQAPRANSSAEAELSKLLANSFDDFELRTFVRDLGDSELSACLIESGDRPDVIVRGFVEALERRGRINQDLFTALESARPYKVIEIREVARRVLREKDSHG